MEPRDVLYSKAIMYTVVGVHSIFNNAIQPIIMLTALKALDYLSVSALSNIKLTHSDVYKRLVSAGTMLDAVNMSDYDHAMMHMIIMNNQLAYEENAEPLMIEANQVCYWMDKAVLPQYDTENYKVKMSHLLKLITNKDVSTLKLMLQIPLEADEGPFNLSGGKL